MNPASTYQFWPARKTPWLPLRLSRRLSSIHSSRVFGGLLIAGLLEKILVVDHHTVGRVPGNAVLDAVDAAGIGEAGQPFLAAEIAHRFKGQIAQFAALRVLGDLGVSDLDDIRGVVPPQGRGDLGADSTPALNLELQFDGRVFLFVRLLETVQEIGGNTVLHQPDRHRLAAGATQAREVAAAAQRHGGNERDDSYCEYTVLHWVTFCERARRNQDPVWGTAGGARTGVAGFWYGPIIWSRVVHATSPDSTSRVPAPSGAPWYERKGSDDVQQHVSGHRNRRNLHEGVDDAIRRGIARAAETLHNLDWFEITQVRGQIVDGRIEHYQVGLKVGFRLDETT